MYLPSHFETTKKQKKIPFLPRDWSVSRTAEHPHTHSVVMATAYFIFFIFCPRFQEGNQSARFWVQFCFYCQNSGKSIGEF